MPIEFTQPTAGGGGGGGGGDQKVPEVTYGTGGDFETTNHVFTRAELVFKQLTFIEDEFSALLQATGDWEDGDWFLVTTDNVITGARLEGQGGIKVGGLVNGKILSIPGQSNGYQVRYNTRLVDFVAQGAIASITT